MLNNIKRNKKTLINILSSVIVLTVVVLSVSCNNGGLAVKDNEGFYSDTDDIDNSIDLNNTDSHDTSVPDANTDSFVQDTSDATTTPDSSIDIDESFSLVTEVTTKSEPKETLENNETETTAEQTEILDMAGAEENKITMTAETLIGIPFADGGSSPDSGFDNSGFIYYVLKQNGYVNCPRGLLEQADMGTKISKMNDLKAGDLVFFSENGTNAQFGGIYIGGGIMINCPSPGNTVRKTDISTSYYVSNFFSGVRVL